MKCGSDEKNRFPLYEGSEHSLKQVGLSSSARLYKIWSPTASARATNTDGMVAITAFLVITTQLAALTRALGILSMSCTNLGEVTKY